MIKRNLFYLSLKSNFQSMSFIKEFTAIRDNNINAKYSVWHLKNYLGK